MNFLILSSNGKCTARPDSTRCKDSGDYFVPNDVVAVGYVPVVYARMCRTGKAIGEQFVNRYYDAVGFGVLLYPATSMRNGAPHFCRATGACFDRTSLMPLTLYDVNVNASAYVAEVAEGNVSATFTVLKDAVFAVFRNDIEVFSCRAAQTRGSVEEAIFKCSVHTTIHKGDMVLAELTPVRALCTRGEGNTGIKTSFCENDVIDIALKF